MILRQQIHGTWRQFQDEKFLHSGLLFLRLLSAGQPGKTTTNSRRSYLDAVLGGREK
jgi:hypothetical protein